MNINFDFDKSDIKANDRAKLQAIADFLKAYPHGQAPDRGQLRRARHREYNLALGERRAHAAQAYLTAWAWPRPASHHQLRQGEAPVCTGHAKSWLDQNRR